MIRKEKKEYKESNVDNWKFSEQICYNANLKGMKPDKMWNNPRANKKLKFKCEINFEDSDK